MTFYNVLLWIVYVQWLVGFGLVIVYAIINFRTGIFIDHYKGKKIGAQQIQSYNSKVKPYRQLMIWATRLILSGLLMFFVLIWLKGRG